MKSTNKKGAEFMSYYGVKRDDSWKKKAPRSRSEDEWDYNIEPVSGKDIVQKGVGVGGLLIGAVVAKKWSSISKFVSINTEIHVLDSRVIRRDYGYDDLYKNAEKVIKESSATLVQIPNLLTSRGSLKTQYLNLVLLLR